MTKISQTMDKLEAMQLNDHETKRNMIYGNYVHDSTHKYQTLYQSNTVRQTHKTNIQH